MSLHPQKISVCCAVSCKHIGGPIVFETTITAKVYDNIIYTFIALLQRMSLMQFFNKIYATTLGERQDVLFDRNFWGANL